MEKLIFPKELILIKLINQKSVWSAITDFSKIKTLVLNSLSVMVVMISQWFVMN